MHASQNTTADMHNALDAAQDANVPVPQKEVQNIFRRSKSYTIHKEATVWAIEVEVGTSYATNNSLGQETKENRTTSPAMMVYQGKDKYNCYPVRLDDRTFQETYCEGKDPKTPHELTEYSSKAPRHLVRLDPNSDEFKELQERGFESEWDTFLTMNPGDVLAMVPGKPGNIYMIAYHELLQSYNRDEMPVEWLPE